MLARNKDRGVAILHRLWVAALVTTLLAACGGPESPENRYLTAVTRNDLETVKGMLASREVDVNYRTNLTGSNALETACGMGHGDLVDLLLINGANPNIVNSKGMTPLQMAAYAGNTEIVETLIRVGANVNARDSEHGYSALAAASSRGHLSTVLLLLDAGADVTATTNAGWTAEQLAQNSAHGDVAKVLSTKRSQ